MKILFVTALLLLGVVVHVSLGIMTCEARLRQQGIVQPVCLPLVVALSHGLGLGP